MPELAAQARIDGLTLPDHVNAAWRKAFCSPPPPPDASQLHITALIQTPSTALRYGDPCGCTIERQARSHELLEVVRGVQDGGDYARRRVLMTNWMGLRPQRRGSGGLRCGADTD